MDSVTRLPTLPLVRLATVALSAVWFIASYVAIFSFPSTPIPGLDRSWMFLLTYGAVHHYQWGRDINFTFGPLGYLEFGELLPGARWPIVGFALVYPSLVIGLTLALALRSRDWLGRVALPVVVPFIAPDVGFTMLTVLATALACSTRTLSKVWVAFAVGALSGFAVLTKIDLALESCSLAVITLLFSQRASLAVVGRPLLAFTAGALLIFIAGFEADSGVALLRLGLCLSAAIVATIAYMVVEKPTPRLFDGPCSTASLSGAVLAGAVLLLTDQIVHRYFILSWELLSGYSAAMSIEGDVRVVVLALVTAACFGWALRALRGQTAFATGLGLIAFLAFKHGFVRQDLHVFGYFATVVYLAAVVVTLGSPGSLRWVAAGTGAAAFAILYGIGVQAFGSAPFGLPTMATFSNDVRALQNALTLTDDEARAGLRDLTLPPLLSYQIAGRPFAALPWELDIPYANDLQPIIAPVPQLYTAYAPALDDADRDWLAGEGAPADIVFQSMAIDGRYVFSEAPATLTTMWCNYAWRASGAIGPPPSYSLLERIPNRCAKPVVVEHGSIGWGAAFVLSAVAANHAQTVSFAIHPSVIGSLVNIFWKLPPVRLHVSGQSFGDADVRIIPAVANDGIILAPFIVGADDVAAFFGSRGTTAGPVSVSLETRYPWMYSSTMEVTIRQIERVSPPTLPP